MAVSLEDVQMQLDWLRDAMMLVDPELRFASAREVGVQDRLLPMALKTRADLAPGFLEIVVRLPDEAPADPLAPIRALSVEDRAFLGRFIAGAYLASSEVMQRLGYPGFETLTTEVDYDEIIAAIESIVARGPCYRVV